MNTVVLASRASALKGVVASPVLTLRLATATIPSRAFPRLEVAA